MHAPLGGRPQVALVIGSLLWPLGCSSCSKPTHDLDPATGQPAATTELVDLAQHSKAEQAELLCTRGDCLIRFAGDPGLVTELRVR